jgi:hypothetical protein
MSYPSKEIIERLESLKRSYEAARDTNFSENPDVRFIDGIRAGLNVAINGINSEIVILKAGQEAERKVLEPQTGRWPKPQPASIPSGTFQHFDSEEQRQRHLEQVAEAQKNGAPF